MKTVTLNLASRPFRNNTVVASVLLGVTAALFAATAINVYVFLHYGSGYAELRGEREEAQTRLVQVEAEEGRLAQEIRRRDFKTLFERGGFANALILRRSFSWTLLFNRLETVVPADVMMTAIRPNITADRIVVRIDGVAKSSGAFISLQDTLQRKPVFSRVYPISERKINPSRPEVTFALNFDYLPRMDEGSRLLVAGAQPVSAPIPAPTPAPTAVPAVTPAAAPEEVAAAAPSPAAAGKPLTTVGRDGRPRDGAGRTRPVVAPGAVLLPSAPLPPAGAAAPGKGKGGKGRGAAPAPKPAPAGGATAPAGPAAALTDAPPSTVVLRPGAVPVPKGEPGLPARPAAARTGRRGALGATPEAAAVRLDLPLTFVARPVGEIYEALGRAHGVRFEIDGGVNRETRISADLSGRRLPDALAAVARLAGHRVTRQGDGAYRVAVPAGGDPIADRPVREESLVPRGETP